MSSNRQLMRLLGPLSGMNSEYITNSLHYFIESEDPHVKDAAARIKTQLGGPTSLFGITLYS